MALPTLSISEQIEALYVAYYGRAGEPDGVAYWQAQLNSGRSFADVAAAFSTQAESKAEHPFLANPSSVSPSAFIENLYEQLLGRSSDVEGFAYWAAQLSATNGDPFRIGILIAQFISGASEANGDAATILNKIEAAKYFTQALSGKGVGGTLNGTLLDHAYRAIAKEVVDNDITSDPATVVLGQAELNTFFSSFNPDSRPAIRTVNLFNTGDGPIDGAISRSPISADGRFIVFHSRSDFGAGDGNDLPDVFLRDMLLQETRMITPGSNGNSATVTISDDGSVISFMSTATNLVDIGTSSIRYVYSWSEDSGFTAINRIGTSGSNRLTQDPIVSGDGEHFAYTSFGDSSDPTSTPTGVYVSNAAAVSTEFAGPGGYPSLSWDGSHVAFPVSGETFGGNTPMAQIALRDANGLHLVSRANDGTPGNGNSWYPSISSDGTMIAFESHATNLLGAGNDTNNAADIFVFNTRTNTISLVSVATDGTRANGGSAAPVISGDGRFVVFESDATSLAGGHAVHRDIFVRDLIRNETHLISVAADGTPSNGFSNSASISEDGRYVTFFSGGANLTPDAGRVLVADGLVQGWWWA